MWWLVLLLCWQANDPKVEGNKALDAKNYAAAADWFGKAVAADDKDFAAHFQLALALSLEGKAAEAIPHYQTVLQLKPGLYEAQLNLGIVLVNEKRWAEAVPPLEAAAAQKPVIFRPQFFLGEALLGAGDPAKAETAFTAAIAADPKSAAAEFGLAQSFVRQKKPSAAAPHYQKAADLDPAYRNAQLDLASLFEQAGQKAEAIAIYQKFSDNPAVEERLGTLLLEAGQMADAIPHLKAAAEKSPTVARLSALAQAYLGNKQPDKGLPLLQRAVATEPRDYALRMFYGRTLRDQRLYVPASQQFLASTQLKPDSVEAWGELAGVLMLVDQYPEALAALDHIRALGGEKNGHFFFRAIILDKLHQVKPAIESYKKFLATANGKNPDEEFKARQRVRILEQELHRR